MTKIIYRNGKILEKKDESLLLKNLLLESTWRCLSTAELAWVIPSIGIKELEKQAPYP